MTVFAQIANPPLNYMVCFKYTGSAWWIWLGLTNIMTNSLEMKMLFPENLMFCDSSVKKQVKYNILSQCNVMSVNLNLCTTQRIFISPGNKFQAKKLFFLQNPIRQSKQLKLKCHRLNCIHLWDRLWQKVFMRIQMIVININCTCVSAVLEDLVLMPVHTKPKDAFKEIDELYDVFQDVKEKWKTDVKHNAHL